MQRGGHRGADGGNSGGGGGEGLAERGPYSLNDVQVWGLGGGGVRGGADVVCVCVWGGGVGGQPQRTALHTIGISFQNSFCESQTWKLVI